ncbi:Ig-like domain-containing protein [Streptomyces sp. CA-243310]|uniref:Ig-like domain-containing protein n=1 Tax=Streptomyces sp. CA-243310 TaxID=3240056 RepID=UPI003D8A149C
MGATVHRGGPPGKRHPHWNRHLHRPGGLNETVTLDSGGTACVTTTALETGTVTVTYAGDTCFLPSTGSTGRDRQPGIQWWCR